jgi:hypothetical protein
MNILRFLLGSNQVVLSTQQFNLLSKLRLIRNIKKHDATEESTDSIGSGEIFQQNPGAVGAIAAFIIVKLMDQNNLWSVFRLRPEHFSVPWWERVPPVLFLIMGAGLAKPMLVAGPVLLIGRAIRDWYIGKTPPPAIGPSYNNLLEWLIYWSTSEGGVLITQALMASMVIFKIGNVAYNQLVYKQVSNQAKLDASKEASGEVIPRRVYTYPKSQQIYDSVRNNQMKLLPVDGRPGIKIKPFRPTV